MRISEHLHIIGGGLRSHGLTHPTDASVYVIDTGAGLVMIDSGSGVESSLLAQSMALCGLDMRRVALLILTHGHLDHSGGAADIHEVSGCEVYAPVDIASVLVDPETTADHEVLGAAQVAPGSDIKIKWRPLPKVIGLEDGDRFQAGPLDIRCHALSGHSEADLVIETSVDGMHCLFTGDLVSGHGGVVHKVRPGFSPYRLKRSLDRLSQLTYEAIFTGHGAFCLTDRGFAVHEAKASYGKLAR